MADKTFCVDTYVGKSCNSAGLATRVVVTCRRRYGNLTVVVEGGKITLRAEDGDGRALAEKVLDPDALLGPVPGAGKGGT